MSVVVTGASGFLGRAVVGALAKRTDVSVRPVARRPVAGALRVESYRQTPTGDVLVHLAEESDRAEAAKLSAASEAEALAILSGFADRFDRVVYASSVALYGDKSAHPHSPDDPVYITDPYTRMKRAAETTVLTAPTGVVARLSNVYGPAMSRANVMTAILKQIPGTGPVSIKDARPIRDFLWIGDAAEGLASLATREGVRGVLNLSTGIGTSIGDAARLALDVAGEPAREIVSTGQARDSTIVADFTRTTQACGWAPRVTLRDGLALLLSTSPVQQS